MAYGTVNADIITTSTGQTLGAGNATAFKNRIINGGMTIDQRNSGASFTNSNTGIYGLDRWLTYGVTSGLLTIQRSTTAPAGFINSQSVTITTSTTANDGAAVDQYIEGNNVYDLNWGTSSGSPVTVSFWVRSSIAGVYNYYVKYFGSSSSYYYITPYTISSANTWQYITLTISAPPSAAGAFTAALNTTYMDTRFVISSSGSTANGTANTWSTTIPNKISGSVDLASNSGATFYITGVQLEVGTQATSFDYRDYGRELIMCQRYYCSFNLPTDTNSAYPATVYNNTAVLFQPLPVANNFRATPTVTATIGTASPTFRQYDGTNPQSPTVTGINLGLRNTGAPFIWGELQYSVSTGSWGSAGYIGNIAWSSGTNSKLKFDAEL
jgi:hypothetical protein